MRPLFLFAAHDLDGHGVEIDVLDKVRFAESAQIKPIEMGGVRGQHRRRWHVQRHQRFAKQRDEFVGRWYGGDGNRHRVQYFFAFLRSDPKLHTRILT